MPLHIRVQHLRLSPARARQAIEVLQVQKREHLVGHTRRQVDGQVLPAMAHVHTRQLKPREQ
jgi:hypothetical protein